MANEIDRPKTAFPATVAQRKYFLDTEFIERGGDYPIELISIGIVREDGAALYAISSEFKSINASEWVQQHVLNRLESNVPRESRQDIAARIRTFVGDDKPEFWAYYADYDWVVFCQLFGSMVDLPKGWPMYCRDLKQLCDSLGNPKLKKQSGSEHNALSDAHWNMETYEFLMRQSTDYAARIEREARLDEAKWWACRVHTPIDSEEYKRMNVLELAATPASTERNDADGD